MCIRDRYTPVLIAVILAAVAFATPIQIDPPLPAPGPGDPASPWHSYASQPVITFAFMTSWDGLMWSDVMKTSALAAIGDLDDQALPYHTITEGNTDFTMRWAGADFFKDWRPENGSTNPGWDLGPKADGSFILAVAYKHNNGPWDHSRYPNNEIYFNSSAPWSFNPFSVDPNSWDFWTVLQHEVIHMLACDDHAGHADEVMYATVDIGIRKYLQESDKEILRKAGYIPEPGTAGLFVIGVLLILVRAKRH